MFCGNCGSQVNDNDKFCGKCGHLLRQQMSSHEINKPHSINTEEVIIKEVNIEDVSTEEVNTSEDETVLLGMPNTSDIQIHLPEHGTYYNEDYQRRPENNAPPYTHPTAPVRKARKAKIVILIVLIITLTGVGFGGYNIYKATRPKAPIENMLTAITKGDWEKFYDNIYWEVNSNDYLTQAEFAALMQNYMSEDMLAMVNISDMSFIVENVGDEYLDDNLNIIRDVTIKVQVLGLQTGSEEINIQVVKSDEKIFFFFPRWKISLDSADSFF